MERTLQTVRSMAEHIGIIGLMNSEGTEIIHTIHFTASQNHAIRWIENYKPDNGYEVRYAYTAENVLMVDTMDV